ncbi:hypothetical protein A3G55_00265 [Candidatus Giovannonibacteria bacterium RIFCSPLOWO2_12_FULL_44_25]|uniref:Uncharacterized protein n=2 Tax=Candidatus Giovannoniibacteriota TaxID=1752738 RepID=A0A1F5W904_9BACT|nr:MAG: hypothetical protein UW15_C0021G0007 [Parcubacteria group bacterium GW2011_GWC1_44_10]KKT59297.1 MAG: hypothetical protein UW53_C0016G0007 [Candidatus Giovannonibacteria bacterium GW2011_GWA1_44_25]KKU29054.1 MAG: hypothetical protein UX43_C0016G0009 [Candidatus Giovannonibacteria bacterium GW2011_GWB1_46_20]OGF49269.1 MAG: hypothetical protein A2120_03050 [Candidatus Giovannonibacteria bacterium GWA2_45_15]OGF60167.1 MAG: hypothetical protein A2656_04320 [Candidatus Giovannonibacteria 
MPLAEAAMRGAKRIWLIEKEVNMLSPELLETAFAAPYRIVIYTEDLERILAILVRAQVDVAFCQQGVNYWLDEITAKLVANVLAKNGLFIFNTFNKNLPKNP